MLSEDLRTEIDQLVSNNKVVLFMKGTRGFPQCGFSATVVGILDEYLADYQTVNVLADQNVREGIKEYSDWPTIPQLYVDGEFVGGCDIIKDMDEGGDLSKALGVEKGKVEPPSIKISAAAASALKAAAEDEEHQTLRFEISPRYEYGLSFGPEHPGDLVVETSGIKVLFDTKSARRANGLSLDYVEGPNGAGFKIDNPNEPPKVQTVSVVDLKERLDQAKASGEALHLFDVRTDEERAAAKIDAAKQLTPEVQEEILTLPKDTPLYFHCKAGGRSLQAATHFLSNAGFTNVYDVDGGILAWAEHIDPSMKPI